mmetsp:Transcript_32742/g.105236  ORF Transcript_32742/g.105236 Transcript_32742/m.105236 type:complete len:431 (-) Transcript_32742:35-1327(-)
MQAREVNFLSSSGLGVQRRLAPRRVERGELGRRLDAVASGQRLECRGGAFVQHHASRSRLLLARLLGVARAAHGAGQAAHRRQVLAQPSPKARCEALRVEDDEAVAVPVRPLAGECPRLYCGADVGAARQHRAEQLDEHAEAVPLVARRLLSASERVERAVLHHLRWVGGVSPASVDGPAGRDPLPDPVHHLHLAHRHHRRRHVELERVAPCGGREAAERVGADGTGAAAGRRRKGRRVCEGQPDHAGGERLVRPVARRPKVVRVAGGDDADAVLLCQPQGRLHREVAHDSAERIPAIDHSCAPRAPLHDRARNAVDELRLNLVGVRVGAVGAVRRDAARVGVGQHVCRLRGVGRRSARRGEARGEEVSQHAPWQPHRASVGQAGLDGAAAEAAPPPKAKYVRQRQAEGEAQAEGEEGVVVLRRRHVVGL